MKYLKQFVIIFGVSFAAEAVKWLLPFPIPGAIYGFGIMLFLLSLRVIRPDDIRETAEFLLECMPLMCIPPVIALVDYGNVLGSLAVPIITISAVTTFLVALATGRVSQAVIRWKQRRGEKEKEA